MKMTRLEWRYLQRIALDHPYYDTHKPPLSDAEARAIMESNNMMTGREFVDSIYAKLGMTRPVKEKKRLAWLRDIGEFFAIPPIRKIAIAILVVLLMTVFFAATPTGRAIAESVIRYITTLFDDGSMAINQSENEIEMLLTDFGKEMGNGEQDNSDDTESYVFLDSFDEFRKVTGKTPIVLPLQCTNLYYEYDEMIDYLALYSTYATPNGEVITYQIWNAERIVSSTLSDYLICDKDSSIYYSVEDNGDLYCIKVLDDSVFTLLSKEHSSFDDLIEMLREQD